MIARQKPNMIGNEEGSLAPARKSKGSDPEVVRLAFRRIEALSTKSPPGIEDFRRSIIALISNLSNGDITPDSILDAFNFDPSEKEIINRMMTEQGVTLIANRTAISSRLDARKRKPRVLDKCIEKEEIPFEVVHPTDEHCASIYKLCHNRLGYEKKTDDLLKRQITYEDWSSGWMVNLPESEQAIRQHKGNTMVIPDPKEPKEVLSFLEYLLIGHGIDSTELQQRFISMPDDKIDINYRDLMAGFKQGRNLQKVAWIEMSAVDAERQDKSEYVGIAEFMEFKFLYKIFREHPEIEYILSEWMIYPDVNIPTTIFHRQRIGVVPFASRSTDITRSNGVIQTFDWTVIDHPAFRTLIERYPDRDVSFEQFIREYKELIPR